MLGLTNIYMNNVLAKQQQTVNAQKSDRQSLINKNYREIYNHESAHKAAAGSFGGAIVIERNSDGIPVGGHVDIKMPALDPKNLDKTINDANVVFKAAMAPSDPSGQDYKVASQAMNIRSRAIAMKNDSQTGQKLNLMA